MGEINEALKPIHMHDWGYTVVTCPSLGKAAVGLGGKKNAERAAKIAIAVALAGSHPRATYVQQTYPTFARLLRADEDNQCGFGREVKKARTAEPQTGATS